LIANPAPTRNLLPVAISPHARTLAQLVIETSSRKRNEMNT
jgi:hypothetical protein